MVGGLGKDNRIYPGRLILVSGDCKRETGEEHAQLHNSNSGRQS